MDLGGWANMVAIVGGVIAMFGAVGGGLMWVGGWMERRQQDSKKFTTTDRKVGKLADTTTIALRNLEKKVDEHLRDDSTRFLHISNELGEIKAGLGEIKGALGIRH